VENAWLKCGLDMKSLEDVRKHFNYNHVLDILHTISGTDTKDSSPGNEEGADKALSPEIKQTLLSCLSKQPLVVSLQESAKNLPNDYVEALVASLTRDLAQGTSDTTATPGAPPIGKATTPSLGKDSSPKPDNGSDSSSEATPKEKMVPPTKISAAKEEDSSGMPTTAIIGLAVSGIALLALLCLCCCMCRGNRTSSYDSKDDKPLLSLNLSDLSGMNCTDLSCYYVTCMPPSVDLCFLFSCFS
jgi:hypothetical protein